MDMGTPGVAHEGLVKHGARGRDERKDEACTDLRLELAQQPRWPRDGHLVAQEWLPLAGFDEEEDEVILKEANTLTEAPLGEAFEAGEGPAPRPDTDSGSGGPLFLARQPEDTHGSGPGDTCARTPSPRSPLLLE